MKIAVIGHAEHVTLGRVEAVPNAGEIVHMRNARIVAAGGGGLALTSTSCADVH